MLARANWVLIRPRHPTSQIWIRISEMLVSWVEDCNTWGACSLSFQVSRIPSAWHLMKDTKSEEPWNAGQAIEVTSEAHKVDDIQSQSRMDLCFCLFTHWCFDQLLIFTPSSLYVVITYALLEKRVMRLMIIDQWFGLFKIGKCTAFPRAQATSKLCASARAAIAVSWDVCNSDTISVGGDVCCKTCRRQFVSIYSL